jgi:hypothetical protein
MFGVISDKIQTFYSQSLQIRHYKLSSEMGNMALLLQPTYKHNFFTQTLQCYWDQSQAAHETGHLHNAERSASALSVRIERCSCITIFLFNSSLRHV